MPGILEDPLTGDFPSRNELEEEEEAALGNNLPEQYNIKPQFDVSEECGSPGTLIVLIGAAASILADTAFGPVAQVGSISVPELKRLRSPLEEELGVEGPRPHHFTLFKPQDGSDILIAASKRPLPAEQASTWAESVLATLSPSSVVAVTSILSMEYRGPGAPSEENLVFKLGTTTHATDSAANIPTLPPGTMLSGLAAALLEQCENGGKPCTAITAVENSPVPETSLVCSLGDAVCSSVGRKVLDGTARAAVSNAVDGMYRSSASNSMFI